MEHGDAQREPDAHEEVLDIVCGEDWEGQSDGIGDLGEDPVRVEEEDGSERQAYSADFENGVPAVDHQEHHPREQEKRPCCAEGNIESTHLVEVRRALRERIQGR